MSGFSGNISTPGVFLQKTTTPVNRSDGSYIFTDTTGNVKILDANNNEVNLSSSGGGVTSHSDLTNLNADDHTQYALLNGRGTGQTLVGGDISLTLKGRPTGTASITINDNFTVVENTMVVNSAFIATGAATMQNDLYVNNNLGTNNIIGNTEDGDITIDPNGVGRIMLNADTFVNNIRGLTANSDITLLPNGFGQVNVSNKKVTNLAMPELDSDAANKGYVDAIAQGLAPKQAVKVKTPRAVADEILSIGDFTVPDTISNLEIDLLDGIVLVNNDRVLFADGTLPSDKYGIYVRLNNTTLVRAVDAGPSELPVGSYTFVTSGTVHGGQGWALVINNESGQVWTQITSAISNHAALSGLLADDHTQYMLSAGRAGGQAIAGGNNDIENLIIRSTNGSAKGKVIFEEVTQSTNTDNGAVHVAGGMSVKKNLNIGGDSLVVGNMTVNNNFTADNFTANNNVTVAGTLTTGPVHLNGLVNVNNDFNVSGDTNLSSDVFVTGSLTVLSSAEFNNDITATTNLIVNNNVTIDHDLNLNNAGNLSTSNDLNINPSNGGGSVNINSIRNSDDKLTGALVVAGGVGIEKDVNVGGIIRVAGGLLSRGGDLSLQPDMGGIIQLIGETDMNNNNIIHLSDPLNNDHAANKDYVDKNDGAKASVKVMFEEPPNAIQNDNTITSANNGVLVLDTVPMALNTRVLMNEPGFVSGIYIVTQLGSVSTPWIITKTDEFIKRGTLVFVELGSYHGGQIWYYNGINFDRFNTSAQITTNTDQISPDAFKAVGGTISLNTSKFNTMGGNDYPFFLNSNLGVSINTANTDGSVEIGNVNQGVSLTGLGVSINTTNNSGSTNIGHDNAEVNITGLVNIRDPDGISMLRNNGNILTLKYVSDPSDFTDAVNKRVNDQGNLVKQYVKYAIPAADFATAIYTDSNTLTGDHTTTLSQFLPNQVPALIYADKVFLYGTASNLIGAYVVNDTGLNWVLTRTDDLASYNGYDLTGTTYFVTYDKSIHIIMRGTLGTSKDSIKFTPDYESTNGNPSDIIKFNPITGNLTFDPSKINNMDGDAAFTINRPVVNINTEVLASEITIGKKEYGYTTINGNFIDLNGNNTSINARDTDENLQTNVYISGGIGIKHTYVNFNGTGTVMIGNTTTELMLLRANIMELSTVTPMKINSSPFLDSATDIGNYNNPVQIFGNNVLVGCVPLSRELGNVVISGGYDSSTHVNINSDSGSSVTNINTGASDGIVNIGNSSTPSINNFSIQSITHASDTVFINSDADAGDGSTVIGNNNKPFSMYGNNIAIGTDTSNVIIKGSVSINPDLGPVNIATGNNSDTVIIGNAALNEIQMNSNQLNINNNATVINNSLTVSGANTLINNNFTANGEDVKIGSTTGTAVVLSPITLANSIASKEYVDAVAQGLGPKLAVRAKTTTADIAFINFSLTGSGVLTVDGLTMNINDRILIASTNGNAFYGIYKVLSNNPWSIERSEDANNTPSVGEVRVGIYTFVQDGATYINQGWSLITFPGDILDTSAQTWSQITSAGSGVSDVQVSGAGLSVSTAGSVKLITLDATAFANITATGSASISNNMTVGRSLTVSGDVFMGSINASNISIGTGTNNVIGIGDGNNSTVNIGYGTNSSVRVMNLGFPASNTDAVNRLYVDQRIGIGSPATYVPFYSASGLLESTSGFTFDKSTNNLTISGRFIGNTMTVNGSANIGNNPSSIVNIGAQDNTVNVNGNVNIGTGSSNNIILGNSSSLVISSAPVTNINSVATKSYVDNIANAGSVEYLTTSYYYTNVISPSLKETIITNTLFRNAAYSLAAATGNAYKIIRLARGSLSIEIYTPTQRYFLTGDNPFIELAYINSRWERTSPVAYPSTFESRLVIGTSSEPNVSGAGFGYATAIDETGRYIAVGMTGSTGVVFYDKVGDNWTQQALVNCTPISASASLGFSIAMSRDGGYVVAGARDDTNGGAGTGNGAAFIFTRSVDGYGWYQTSKLVRPNPGSGQGYSVGISDEGRYVVVGGPFSASGIGVAYIYAKNTIDETWSIQLELTGNAPNERFGSSVDISGDGTTVVIGAMLANTVRIFKRVNTTWSQLGGDFTGTGGIGSPVYQGFSISMAYDGSTFAVGGSGDNAGVGAVWVWAYNGTTYTQQAKLTPNDNSGASNFGGYVSLRNNTLSIGGVSDNSSIGAAWIFDRIGTVWTQRGNKLTGTANLGASQQGRVALSGNETTVVSGAPFDGGSVQGSFWLFRKNEATKNWSQFNKYRYKTIATSATIIVSDICMSGDGNTIAVGTTIYNTNGAVWVFIKSGNTWASQGAEITTTGSVGGSILFGYSVALSFDGNTLVAGAPGDNGNIGGFGAYTRTAGVWSVQGSFKVGNTAGFASGVGKSICLSADGNTAVVGAPDDASGVGCVFIWNRNGTTWTQQGNKIPPYAFANGCNFGKKVSISADGNILAIGAPVDNSGTNGGSVFVYAKNNNIWLPSGPKLINLEDGTNMGLSLSISGDGTTIAAGSNSSNGGGIVHIFNYIRGKWVKKNRGLFASPTSNTLSQNLGRSVKLSYYGNVLVAGAHTYNNSEGAIYIYTANNERTYTLQKIINPEADGNNFNISFGSMVSISDDARNVLVGSDIGLPSIVTNRSVWVYC